MKFELRHLKIFALVAIAVYGVFLAEQSFAQDCQINLSNPNMDFGQVNRPASNDSQSPNALQTLGRRAVSLNASCPIAAKLVIQVRGAAKGEQFRFAGQGQVGVTLSDALLDGRRVDLAQVSTLGGVPGTPGASIEAMPGDRVIPVSGGMALEGSVLSMQVDIHPMVPTAELRTRDAKTLEANLSFQVSSY